MVLSRLALVFFTTLSSASSFSAAPFSSSSSTKSVRRPELEQASRRRPISTTTTTVSPLRALIYGWDDGDDDDSSSSNTMIPMESSFRYESDLDQCSVEGVAVAESITYDPDRLGSLARLAVHFSPPERALQLDQIERVDILCVSQKHIDIQVAICENGGCLTLAVPIQFPKACDMGSHLEGCVIQNLEDFDETASAVLSQSASASSTDEGAGAATALDMKAKIDYPSWWESPTSPAMVSECENMCSILNDDEFQPEVLALVREAMQQDGQGMTPIAAKVATVGPAGFCFKVRANTFGSSSNNIRSLDVFSPFGGTSKTTVDDLRAAVLGTVATAGGSPA